MELPLGLIEQSLNSRYSLWVREALNNLSDNFTITDPSIAGHPIVFVSPGFLKTTGYTKEEVIGKNGRMFQGPETSRSSVMLIREAVRQEKEIQINLLNYRKDGTPFWVFFQMTPVFSKEDGRIIHFVGVQVPILKNSRKSRRGFLRIQGVSYENEFRACKSFLGSCRRELMSDSISELDCTLNRDPQPDSDSRGVEIEEPCEACDDEKQRAAIAISNILFVLTHHSEVTGGLVCERRCSLSRVGILCSSLNTSLNRIKQSFVLTDPNLPDMPIVYASDEFLKLTGYTRCEVLGRNCRFLSGIDTDSSTLFKIKESLQSEQACTVRILNYRKNKSSFWNDLHISPVRNASGKVAYFVGVQMDEDDKKQDEHGFNPKMRQLSTVGAVKVAVRSLSMTMGCSQEIHRYETFHMQVTTSTCSATRKNLTSHLIPCQLKDDESICSACQAPDLLGMGVRISICLNKFVEPSSLSSRAGLIAILAIEFREFVLMQQPNVAATKTCSVKNQKGILLRYRGEPAKKTMIDKNRLSIAIPKPHSHPLLSSTHTTNVTAIRPPHERQKTK